MRTLLAILGVLIIVVGFCFGFYIDIYMLVKAIVNLAHGGSIAWNVFMLIVREIVGVAIIVACWIIGMICLAAAGD